MKLTMIASLFCFALASFSGVTAIRNSLFIISQAETPSLGVDGLTPIGVQRAEECIPSVFGHLGIGLIVSCTPDFDSGACFAAVATVTPLANALNLTVDTSCDTGDNAQDDCVSDLIAAFAAKSTKAILAVWDAGDEDTFIDNLDIDLPDDDDDDDGVFHHDVITTIRNEAFIGQTSQSCSGIDGQAPGTGVFNFRKPGAHRRSLKAKAGQKRNRSKARASDGK
ncbi:hypothetical protein BDQ12DRAFT_693948 [Crucibulum laeve]|uniref:Uncharacterized protein n=1 Tax=Crucibulum laeve TaxID=68775 RepID=A0A5C3LEK2_9AGAR|nr:hypothetical protein BDQ12DRAFT_693948 [Crucibulum laeve]